MNTILFDEYQPINRNETVRLAGLQTQSLFSVGGGEAGLRANKYSR